jgi:hypothetical protein
VIKLPKSAQTLKTDFAVGTADILQNDLALGSGMPFRQNQQRSKIQQDLCTLFRRSP